MIGMMNGGEASVEFYAAARQSSLYESRKRSTQSRTYTPEGRIMINGEPQSPHGVDDLWQNIITKAVAKKMINDCEKQQNSGPLATIRRLSAKLGLKKSKSHDVLNDEVKVIKEEELVHESASNITQKVQEQQKKYENVDTRYITSIQIDVDEPFINTAEHIARPNQLFDEDSVLARLLEESSRINRREQNFEKNWTDDSGKGSMDEDAMKQLRANNNITVEKL